MDGISNIQSIHSHQNPKRDDNMLLPSMRDFTATTLEYQTKHSTRKSRKRIHKTIQTNKSQRERVEKRHIFGDQCSPSIIIETPHLVALLCVYIYFAE